MVLLKLSTIMIRLHSELLMQGLLRNRSQIIRSRHTQYTGVKGIRNRKNFYESKNNNTNGVKEDDIASETSLVLNDGEYDDVATNTMHVYRYPNISQRVFIIQPYIKWGSKKIVDRTPEQRLKEAEALIRSIPNWSIGLSLKVPLESLEKKAVFGSGKIEELKALIQEYMQQESPLTCIFVSKGTLSFTQKRSLEAEFNIPIMDRYSVVIQILRLHATTAEARLQVAMAELPYIWNQIKDANLSLSRKSGYFLNDTQRELLKSREKSLKLELEHIRSQRQLLRKRRKNANFPIVAVVGYTNAGKTSLIKALSNEMAMQPRDQLFATLDVTAHAGILPCNLEILYMDTVGFMSDLPTGLIECFVATLEDAIMADVLVHVQDLSHECLISQAKHVETTLETLVRNISATEQAILPPIVNVGNKFDLICEDSITNAATVNDLYKVSAKTKSGINALLLEIERQILAATHRRKISMRVRNGGHEMAWLYKNAGVSEMHPCKHNAELMIMNVIISEQKMQQFKQQFCQ